MDKLMAAALGMPPEKLRDGAKYKGVFHIKVFDNRENMNLISESVGQNYITEEGCNAILNILLHTANKINTWYVGVFEDAGTPTPDTAWTYDNWCDTECTEWNGYDEGSSGTNRLTWTPNGASSTGSITNSSAPAEYTSNETETLYGAVLVSVITNGDHTSGTDKYCICCANFASPQPVVDDNVVQVTYTITADDDGV
jgi:hypothetical protein